MKILHVLSSNEYSGAENVACQIIDMFKDCPDIEMLYCSPNGKIADALRDRGIPFAGIEKMSVSELKKIVHREKPDIIHAHDMKASLVSSLVCGETVLVSHIHNNAYASRRVSTKSVAYLKAARKAKTIIWVSEEAKEGYYFKELVASKSVVLKNVVDPSKIKQLAAKDPNHYDYDVIYVGRMAPEKDPERFVRIIHSLVKHGNHICAAMVGTGELEDRVKGLIEQLGLKSVIDYLGYHKNPYGIMQGSKVLLMPSMWEGLPMAQLEAEALGLHVVRTPASDEELEEKVLKGIQAGRNIEAGDKGIAEYKERLKDIYGI